MVELTPKFRHVHEFGKDKSDAFAPFKVKGLSESTMTVLPSFVTKLALATMSSAGKPIVPSTSYAVFRMMRCPVLETRLSLGLAIREVRGFAS